MGNLEVKTAVGDLQAEEQLPVNLLADSHIAAASSEALQSPQANADVATPGKPQAATSDTSSTTSCTRIPTDEDSSGSPTATVSDGRKDCSNQEAASAACHEVVKRASEHASGRDQEDMDHQEEGLV